MRPIVTIALTSFMVAASGFVITCSSESIVEYYRFMSVDPNTFALGHNVSRWFTYWLGLDDQA